MRRSTSASQACGSMPLSFAVAISVYIAAARSPPRSEPANSHDRRPSAMPRNARSAALLLRQIRPPARKRVKAGQRFNIIHGLGGFGVARELGAFGAHPIVELAELGIRHRPAGCWHIQTD